ncbi:type VI secretion system membrane subunit TssM [Salmonella enterica]|nr:type VI secretion system membrane subunit TssM [Salmonella enterica]
MQKFLSLLFSRRALAVVGVLVLALLVWFVGPLVSFDTLRPLASVGSRVVTIALLLMLLVLWLVNWSMSIIGISVLCLAIGFVTPLLALGDVHPFAPLWVRLTLIGFILLMYALYGLYRLWRALRMDEQLLRRFLHPRGEEVPVAGEIKADLRTVNHIVTQAIRQLRQLRVDMPGWRKIFEGKRFLYELPWFMVVGSPGDGKTTALLNTGLQFPLAEQMEQTSRILTVPGGGTLHCDWWFTNEAVLIDTAGRYARHDDGGEVSAAQRNAGEWQGFLGLLRKHRPGAPLNGVILTLNVADLTAQSPAERLAACAALRARLADLRETLGIRFPVYLVVTKMDLLPGFSDYFRTLTSHLRAQIWGFTLPYSRRRKAGDPQALHAACAQELARLTLRLDQGLDTRLQEEYDLKSRQRLYTFPREFAALGEPLTQTQWNGEFDEITRTALDDDAVWKTQYNAHGQPVQETDPEGRVTQYAYDEQGQMCSRTDAAGGTVVTAFDSRGQMTRYTDCSGRSTGYDHDEDGNLTRVTDAEGKVVRISYNRLGLPETVNSPGKQQDRYTWNALGLMSSHRRITGSVESWRYTPRGLLAAHTDEEKRETRWQYTPEGRVTALTNGNGAQYRFSHDADGRLVREVRPDGLSRTFILDDSGYLTAIQTTGTQGGVRRETQQRDALGRLLRTENEHGQRTFSYNRLDQITAVTLTPTEAGQQQHRMQADTVRFEYDRSGWLTAEAGGKQNSSVSVNLVWGVLLRVSPSDPRPALVTNGHHLLNTGNTRLSLIRAGNCDTTCHWQNIDKSIYPGGSADIPAGIKSNAFRVEYRTGANSPVISADLTAAGK